MKSLRTGVIGVGHLGQHHARLYAGLPGSTLVGIVDADARRAKEIAKRVGAAVYDDVGVLLRQVDAVSIAAPTSAHHAVARQCLDAGVHVLVEKPITTTPAEATELITLARARKAVLQVGHIERFNPVMLKARPSIHRPLLVECRRVSPFTGRSTDVDVVLDLMIHDLDLILALAGGEPRLGTGDVQVTLRWNTPVDLDLHVIDPLGEEIYFRYTFSPSGGTLDVDANAGCTNDTPVENVFWPTGGAPG